MKDENHISWCFCPFTKDECAADYCGLYSEQDEMCGILKIAEVLGSMSSGKAVDQLDSISAKVVER